MTRVIRVGWFAFEGFGRPYEGWYQRGSGIWVCAGRAFTRRGALRRASQRAISFEFASRVRDGEFG